MENPIPHRLHDPSLAIVEPVPRWKHEVRVKHHFTTQEDAFSVGTSMIRVGEVLQKSPLFEDFKQLSQFFEEDDIERANALLDDLYDFCDERAIWLA